MQKVKLVELICKRCAIKFFKRPCEVTEYCSKKCSCRATAENRSKLHRVEKECLHCHNKFFTRLCENNNFCSHSHWLKYQTEHRLNLRPELRNIAKNVDEILKQRIETTTVVGNKEVRPRVVSGVYSILNVITNKIYIGSSSKIALRSSQHFTLLLKNKHENQYLQNSFNKYGKEAFVFKILEEVEPVKEKLLEREQYYIDQFKSYDDDFGYNITPTAGSPLGYKWSEEDKQALSVSRKGHIGWFTGKKHTEEVKEKIRKALLGNKNGVGRKELPEHLEKRRQAIIEFYQNHPEAKQAHSERTRQIRQGTKLINGHWIKLDQDPTK